MAQRNIYITTCGILAALYLSAPINAESLSTQEKRKASFLLNFTRFAKWHDEKFNNNDEPINICINDTGDFKRFLNQKVKNKQVGSAKKSVKVINFAKDSNNNNCHLSYIVSEEDAHKVMKNKWLKVGDGHDMAKFGTAINFIEQKEEVRFEVYPSKLDEQGVSMSSELLKLATIIKE